MQLTEAQNNFASVHFNLSVPEGLLSPYSIFFDDFDSLILRLLDQIKIQEIKKEVDADMFHVVLTCGIGSYSLCDRNFVSGVSYSYLRYSWISF